jgi:uncharacterized protein
LQRLLSDVTGAKVITETSRYPVFIIKCVIHGMNMPLKAVPPLHLLRMTIKPQYLEIKPSQIPNAGLGLFTKVFIPVGSLVIEYKGVVTTWDAVKEQIDNDYIYYISRNHVIDAAPTPKSLARYANDAKGLTQLPGINNNCIFKKMEGRVFIKARANIQPGSEILVSYGKQYWDTARNNIALEKERLAEEAKARKAEEPEDAE